MEGKEKGRKEQKKEDIFNFDTKHFYLFFFFFLTTMTHTSSSYSVFLFSSQYLYRASEFANHLTNHPNLHHKKCV